MAGGTEFRQSVRLFLQSSESGRPPPPHRHESVYPPPPPYLWFRGEGHTRLWEREGSNSDDGTDTVVLYIYVLCGRRLLRDGWKQPMKRDRWKGRSRKDKQTEKDRWGERHIEGGIDTGGSRGQSHGKAKQVQRPETMYKDLAMQKIGAETKRQR
jgi:hypothetical protein